MILSGIPWFWQWGLIALAVIPAGAWFWRRTALRGGVRFAVGALRLAAISLICWILSNPMRSQKVREDAPQAVVLVDQSKSMDFPSIDSSRKSRLEQAMDLSGQIRQSADVQVSFFGSTVADRPMKPDAPGRGASLLSSAIRQVLSRESPPRSIVVISDGAAQDAADLPLVAASGKSRGVAVGTVLTGGDFEVKNAAITACDAPAFSKAGSRVPVTLTVGRDGCRDQVLTVLLQDDKGKTVSETSLVPDAAQSAEQAVTLQVAVGTSGFSGKLTVRPVEGEITLADNELPLTIPARGEKLRILYMEGTNRTDHGIPEPMFLTEALATEGMEVDLLVMNASNDRGGSVLVGWPWKTDPVFKADPAHAFPKTREELYQYDAVICSDIPRVAFTDEQIQWTVDLVAERGGAFMMVGGKSSFGSGMWDQTPWDSLIPLDMAGAERGLTFDRFKPFWPPEALRHPLLARFPLQPGESLTNILAEHPLFLGTNYVKRAKPAATVIMRQGTETGMPIMAVQPFGKGRTMGFASDVTFYWGTFHNRAWGPPETAVPVQAEVDDPVYRKTPAKFYNNEYFRRFWAHAMRWLTEGSLRAKGGDFIAGTPQVIWPRGTKLPVTALSPDDSILSSLAKGSCTAEIPGVRGSRTRLHFDAASRRFEGQIPWPVNPPAECTVLVEASAPGLTAKQRASFTVRIPSTDVELAAPSAKPRVLAALAEESGGAVLRSPEAVVAWLAGRGKTAEEMAAIVQVPVWSRAWLLLLLMVLLSAEWLIRRIYG